MTPFVALGTELIEPRMANAVPVGLSLVFFFHLVRRHAGPPAGFFAVAHVPVWPVVIYAATTLYPQTLAALLLLLSIWFLGQLNLESAWRIAAIAGGAYAIYFTRVRFWMPFDWLIIASNGMFIGHAPRGDASLLAGQIRRGFAARQTSRRGSLDSGHNSL